jgi:carboxylesterase
MTASGILSGAEPFYKEGGKVGVLVSHGFTGSPQSMRYLAEGLARAGFTVALPLLTGHGTTPEDMAVSTATEWTRDIKQAIDWLAARCDTLFMTGLSMGGTLTLWAAGQYPDRFAGIIPINGAVFLSSPDMAGLAFMPGAPGFLPGIGSDIKAEGVKELAYDRTPVAAIKELFALAKVTEEMLPRIKCPTLVVVSADDHVVPPPNAEYITQKIRSEEKQILRLANSYHVATIDNDKDVILQAAVAFIKQHS